MQPRICRDFNGTYGMSGLTRDPTEALRIRHPSQEGLLVRLKPLYQPPLALLALLPGAKLCMGLGLRRQGRGARPKTLLASSAPLAPHHAAP